MNRFQKKEMTKETIEWIVIKYPPDFDGELHIEVRDDGKGYNYNFIYAHKDENAWEVLVKTAREIIAQENRQQPKSLWSGIENDSRKNK